VKWQLFAVSYIPTRWDPLVEHQVAWVKYLLYT